MQTGAVEFVLAYNPEHGFLGDVLEVGVDLLPGNLIMSGNARNLRGFFQAGIDEKVSFNIAAHSQGGLFTYRAMRGLDFSADGKITTGSLLLSGAPVDSDDFYIMAKKGGFKVDKDITKSNVLFQVNRPEGVTSYFGIQMVDPVSDMPFVMGGNGTFKESFLSLRYVFSDKDNPHSDYLCQGLTCAGAGNQQPYLESARDKYYNPTIIEPLSK